MITRYTILVVALVAIAAAHASAAAPAPATPTATTATWAAPTPVAPAVAPTATVTPTSAAPVTAAPTLTARAVLIPSSTPATVATRTATSTATVAAVVSNDPRLAALALAPKESIAYINIPNLRKLEDDLKRFNKETGSEIGQGTHPVLDLVSRRTGIQDGLDLDGCACIAFLDPKKFRDRYTVYILPVADWDALLKSTAGEEMTQDLYALTGTAGPRFVARRGKFALVTSSIRTMDAVADATRLMEGLAAEPRSRAAGSPTIYVDVRKIKDAYEREIAQWFRAATGQVYESPEAVPFADMLVTYLLGIANFIDQLETIEAGLNFGPDGLGVDLAVKFLPGASIADFLASETPGASPLPAVTDRPLTSGVTLRIDPAKRTEMAMRITRFFLTEAPRPQPLTDATKKQILEAVETFTGSLGEHMILLTTPAAQGQGLTGEVTIFDLKDVDQFRKGVTLLASASESLADQLDLYLKFEQSPEQTEVAGVPVVTYVPKLRFGIPSRHVQFRERLKNLYGPDGLTYRVAIVGNQAIVATGSDLTLFRDSIERLKAGKEPPPSAAVQRMEKHVSPTQNMFIAMSLPEYLGLALLRGNTPADKVGTIDPGQEVVGIGLRAEKGVAKMTTWWPHEQIRLGRELLNRAAPELAEVPESLFEPTPEGPPKPGAGTGPTPPGSPLMPRPLPTPILPPLLTPGGTTGLSTTPTTPATPTGSVPAIVPTGTAPKTTGTAGTRG
jgi:hypothetical protein